MPDFPDRLPVPKVIGALKMLSIVTPSQEIGISLSRPTVGVELFMLVGTQDWTVFHQLYQTGGEEVQNRILDGFYFNS